MTLEEKIKLHSEAYQAIGKEIPPYRATRKELKEWFEKNRIYVPQMDNGDKPHYDEMGHYLGVEIEVVN